MVPGRQCGAPLFDVEGHDCWIIAWNVEAMASNLRAADLLAMTFNLEAMAFNLIAMESKFVKSPLVLNFHEFPARTCHRTPTSSNRAPYFRLS